MVWETKVVNFLKSSGKKTIFLVDLKSDIARIGGFLSKSLCGMPTPYVVVFFGMDVPECFMQGGLKAKASEDYLTREDCENIDRYIFGKITKSWYLYKDSTLYRGIHLGKILEYDFQKYLVPRVKNIEIIKKAVAKEKAERIVVIEDRDELTDVAGLYAGFVNTPILKISLRQNNRFFLASQKIRGVLTRFLTNTLDEFSYRRLIANSNQTGFVLTDAKLHKHFKRNSGGMSFMLCPFERGVVVRFNLIRDGFSYLPFYFEKNRGYLKDWVVYRKKWKNLSSDENFKDIFIYDGIPLWGMITQKAAAFFMKDIPRIASNINMLDGLTRKKKIKIAVLRNDVKEMERTIILSLRLQKIPSLVIQHGIMAEPNGHNALLADKFAAWGKAALDWYGRYENLLDRFEITGNPRFDCILNWRPGITREDLRRRLTLKEDRGIILFVTQQISKFSSFWTDDLFWVMADRLLEAMRLFPDKQLVIKADPYEDLTPYLERISAKRNNNAVAIRDIDIYTLIYFSELIIIQDSTAGLEAMFFDKPLISVNLTKRQDRVAYARKGAAIGVYEAADLASAISRALSDRETIEAMRSARKVFIDEYAYKTDGRAAERLMNLINVTQRAG